MEQHQKELEAEFEARFPALYKKALAMRPAPSSGQAFSPPPGSPPPPFGSEAQPFRDIDWTGPSKDNDDDFELRKAPLVEPLASGLEKMREAGNMARTNSRTTQRSGFSGDFPAKAKTDYYADDYEHDYDEIDPKSEGLKNDPGFQKAGAASAAAGPGTAAAAGDKALEKGAEDTVGKKAGKKRPQLWERLRGSAGK